MSIVSFPYTFPAGHETNMSMPSTRPKVDEKVKTFGQNVAPQPLNPAENQLQLYPVTMEVDGVKAPRYVHVLCVSKCMQEIHMLAETWLFQ